MDSAIFSEVCGENIRVSPDGKTAQWEPTYSGGIVFSGAPLRRQDNDIHLSIDGSGHVEIGIVQTDPLTLQGDKVRKIYQSAAFKVITQVRVHRKRCEVRVINTGSYVCTPVSPGEDRQYGVHIENKKKPVWLLINIKFGSAIATLGPPAQFHSVTGENITFNEENRRVAKLKVQNPAAICCIKQFQQDSEVEIEIEPLDNPHLYHLQLGVTSISPDQMHTADPQALSISKRPLPEFHQARWRPIQKFENKRERENNINVRECKGKMTLRFTSQGQLCYNHESGLEGKEVLNVSTGRHVVLELFRVSVKLLTGLRRTSSCYEHAERGKHAVDIVGGLADLNLRETSGAAENVWRSSSTEDDDGGYISPTYFRESISSFRNPRSPCESSWDEHRVSKVIGSLDDLSKSLKEEGIDSNEFERRIEKIVDEMKTITSDYISVVDAAAQRQPEESQISLSSARVTQPSDGSNFVFYHSNEARSVPCPSEGKLQEMSNKLDDIEKHVRQQTEAKDMRGVKIDKIYESLKHMKYLSIKISDYVKMDTTIRRNYCELLDKLQPFPLIHRLFENEVIQKREHQELRALNPTNLQEITARLLDFLQDRIVKRSAILDALKYSNQMHLIDKLLPPA